MIALRYNENFYVAKGYFERKAFLQLLNLGVKYENYRFIIPVNVLEEVAMTVDITFINDNLENYIYTGLKDPELIKDSLYAVKDDNGMYIYVLGDNITPPSSIKVISAVPYFNINLSKIKNLNIEFPSKLYLDDLISNTNLPISKEYKHLFISDNNTLYVHQIINRICLNKINN